MMLFGCSFLLILAGIANSLIIQRQSHDGVQAVRNVLKRLPEWIYDEFSDVGIFDEDVNKLDTSEDKNQVAARIDVTSNGKKKITGRSPVDVLYAINVFLRSNCYTQISWRNSSYGNRCQLPGSTPILHRQVSPVRYFGNQCTFSYSFAWWQWGEWERFIDWLALNGFNTLLMPIGQEIVWRNVFMKFGVQREDLDLFFTSSAYLPWQRMGNLKAYGGGLSDDRMNADSRLAVRIIERCRQVGIVPIMPTFVGFVPDVLRNLYPENSFRRMPCWNGFESSHSCLLSIEPKDPLFIEIGKEFLKEQMELYGQVSNVYHGDPLNEISPSDLDPSYLKQLSNSIITTCRLIDPNCIWLIQSWQFTYGNWPNWATKSFLSGPKIGQLIVLDLYAEEQPAWIKTSSFYGHFYIWGFLHNFGGTREMRGSFKSINKGYQMALENRGQKLIGAGLTMEAINQNYVVYQFMIDRMWTNSLISLNNWLKVYSASRYSVDSKIAHKLWSMLSQTIYNEPNRHGGKRFSVYLYQRPDFGKKIEYWFPVDKVLPMLKKSIILLKSTYPNNALLTEDTSDILRTVLQFEMANENLLSIYEAYYMEDRVEVGRSCNRFLKNFVILDSLAVDSINDWTKAAIKSGTNWEDKSIYGISSRDILTTWGPNGENIDYSHREWSGLLTNYYAARWEYFCEWLIQNDKFNKTDFNNNIFAFVEKPFLIS